MWLERVSGRKALDPGRRTYVDVRTKWPVFLLFLWVLARSQYSVAAVVWTAPVRVHDGFVKGEVTNHVEVYRGIPYAAPPTGVLRWREPQPAQPWQGIRDGTQFAPECPQVGTYPPNSPSERSSEDCLYLNIWRPSGHDGERLPVLVWFYGGSLKNGSGANPLYSGDTLAREGIVVVTVNYRLGVLGFLAHPELTGESLHRASGDYGLLDAIAALRWIQGNIAAFGGDPDGVTIAGQSVGASIVSVLVTSPIARGLFRRAIGESGGLFEPLNLAPEYTLKGAERDGSRFVSLAGAKSIDELRRMPVGRLLTIPFTPRLILDDYSISSPPFDVYCDYRQADVPLLVGWNADEGAAFLPTRTVTTDNLAAQIEKGGFPGFFVWWAGPKNASNDQEAKRLAEDFYSDMKVRWDVWTWARLASSHDRADVYLYQFTRVPLTQTTSPYNGLGATHGVEVAYVFGHLDHGSVVATTDDRNLSVEMVRYWTNFVKWGSPNGPDLPRWAPFRQSEEAQMLFLGERTALGPVDHERRLKTIDFLYALARQVLGHAYLVGIIGLLVGIGISLLVQAWLMRKAEQDERLLYFEEDR